MPRPPLTTGRPARDGGFLTWAGAGTKALRQQRDRLPGAVRHRLGRQLDALTAPDLASRVDELTRHHQVADQLQQATEENAALRARATSLEQVLAAAGTSLRRVIRTEDTAR
ncbi:hypothetical protein ABZ471_39380 [Streptomyces sp. NPDC005728]|uniref:hypothetical protein n=1 Tax=Streptomyces sp. NPDC005728 TaxID=3157054 RepID=UPI0033E40769